MADELHIKVKIAGREYPLTIEREEEEKIRLLVKVWNDKMKHLKEEYNILDSQDLMSMAGLQMLMENLAEAEPHISEDVLATLDKVKATLGSTN